MSALNSARIDRAKRIFDFNHVAINITKLLLIKEYAAEQAEMETIMSEITGVSGLIATDTKGITNDKEIKLVAMGTTIFGYCQRALPLARRAKDANLIQVLGHSLTYFLSGPAEQCFSRATSTVGALISVDGLKLFTNILAADVIIINKSIADYAEVMNAPTTVIHNKKASGTDLEDSLLDRVEFCTTNMGCFIHSYYPDSPFSQEFDLTNRLLIQGVRHNPVNIKVVDSITGLPVNTATATKVKFNIVGKANNEGVIAFDSCTAGVQHFLVAAAGYTTQDIAAKIIHATTTELLVKLVKI